jgi:hypothetical protein
MGAQVLHKCNLCGSPHSFQERGVQILPLSDLYTIYNYKMAGWRSGYRGRLEIFYHYGAQVQILLLSVADSLH